MYDGQHYEAYRSIERSHTTPRKKQRNESMRTPCGGGMSNAPATCCLIPDIRYLESQTALLDNRTRQVGARLEGSSRSSFVEAYHDISDLGKPPRQFQFSWTNANCLGDATGPPQASETGGPGSLPPIQGNAPNQITQLIGVEDR